jgi:hypothetical protein
MHLKYILFLDMSNRIFDDSALLKRRRNQTHAYNMYLNTIQNKPIIYNPQNSNGDASMFNIYTSGAQTQYFEGLLGGREMVSLGGIAPILSIQETLTNNSSPSPVVSDPVVPDPALETQLLINPEFTNIVSDGAYGWTSSIGWEPLGYQIGTKPTAVTNMPIRQGVYPTSTLSGFVIFSYNVATISQTVSNIDLTDKNTIKCILNIVNVANNSPDIFTFQVQYKDNTNTILYTSTTGSTQAPSTWTDYTLTLTRTGNLNFDSIKSITVNITGDDIGFWAGQYGPAMDYCRLIVS